MENTTQDDMGYSIEAAIPDKMGKPSSTDDVSPPTVTSEPEPEPEEDVQPVEVAEDKEEEPPVETVSVEEFNALQNKFQEFIDNFKPPKQEEKKKETPKAAPNKAIMEKVALLERELKNMEESKQRSEEEEVIKREYEVLKADNSWLKLDRHVSHTEAMINMLKKNLPQIPESTWSAMSSKDLIKTFRAQVEVAKAASVPRKPVEKEVNTSNADRVYRCMTEKHQFS